MQGFRKYIILLIVGSVAFAALFSFLTYRAFMSPNGVKANSVFLVPPGQGLIRTARLLNEAGLISNKDIFRVGVMFKGQERNLKAGEFLIPPGVSMNDIMNILVKGEVIQHQLTIVEGWTSWQIEQYLNSLDNLVDPIEAPPIEGSILPESYHYTYGTSRFDLLSRMQDQQLLLLDQLWDNRDPNLPFTSVEEVIILASIVEKETGVAGERSHIAGVFINRLNRNMRLQSDPTIIYGIDPKGFLDRGLRKSEIENKDNPYNTYQIDGLPPTPICHPGRAAIEAVLHPMQTDDIYFVADGTGGHVFSKTLEEHQKNVTRWRQIESSRK
ncbi:MAG: endolytic transglycosylase MltG [Kordiimonadaceae bacterium]|nr:endolytic transglycosylase MltG [Kordiimonadaceae bacterium]